MRKVLRIFLVGLILQAFNGFGQVSLLDTSFNRIGYLKTSLGLDEERVNSVVRLSDGKLVAVGYVSVGVDEQILLIRYNADGTLDSSYGDNGTVLIGDLGGYYSCKAFAAALQKDGKIVVAGSVSNGSFHTDPSWVLIARFDQNGGLDKSFNTSGFLILKLGVESWLRSIAVLPDGKILAAGTIEQQSLALDFLAIKCNADGIIDKNFGTDGIAITDFNASKDMCTSLAVLSNGYFFLAGYTQDEVNDYDFALAKFNTYGRLDYSFSLDGKVSTDFFGYGDKANAIAVQTDGKIIIGGEANDENILSRVFALARYTSAGALDASFDKDGKVSTSINNWPSAVMGLTIQSDNKILAAGTGQPAEINTNDDYAILRYNANGSQDLTFSEDGMVLTDVDKIFNYANSLILLPDRKIIIGGYSSDNKGENVNLIKYNTDGSLDRSFNNSGIVQYNHNLTHSLASSVKIMDDGRLIVGGTANSISYYRYASALYKTNGNLEPTYNGDGIVLGGGLDASYCNDLGVQRDGKIVKVGYTKNKWDPEVFMLVRIMQNGIGDRGFGDNGMIVTDVGSSSDIGTCLAMQPDDKILAGGYSYNGNDWDFALVRYLPDGTLDPSFSNDGKIITDIGAVNNGAEAIALQKDGKIILGGFTEVNNQLQFALVRFTQTGNLDLSFNGTGKVTIDVSPDGGEEIYALWVQEDGKILVVGDAFNGLNTDYAIVRLNSNGSLDKAFSNDGIMLIDINSNYNDAVDVALSPNGKIILAGTCVDNNKYAFSIIRLHADGRVDENFGDHGVAIISLGTGDDIAAAVAVQKDGKIVVAGSSLLGFRIEFAVIRIISDLNVGTIDQKSGETTILIYPNPVYNEAILEYSLVKDDNVRIQLMELNGKVLQTYISNEKKLAGDHKEKIKLPESLKEGHYLLAIKTANGMVAVKLTKKGI